MPQVLLFQSVMAREASQSSLAEKIRRKSFRVNEIGKNF